MVQFSKVVRIAHVLLQLTWHATRDPQPKRVKMKLCLKSQNKKLGKLRLLIKIGLLVNSHLILPLRTFQKVKEGSKRNL